MHTNSQQLWLSWSRGEIDDDTAQGLADAADARKRARPGRAARPPDAPAAASESRRAHRREKLFGDGRPVPLDRNAKVRVMTLARALSRRTEPGKAYGAVTAKALAVLQALLWGFHNAASGRCFPSYEAISERAGCCRASVYNAIRALEQAGVLTWVHRIKRVREWVPGLFGKTSAWRSAVQRTSNGYSFRDPLASSESNFQTGTTAQAASKKEFASNGPSEPPRPLRSLGEGHFRRACRNYITEN
jgi:helix-turn-helix protein